MAITGQAIVDDALAIANDTAGEYWPATGDGLRAVNAAQKAIVSRLTKAGAQASFVTWAAGSRQTISGLSLARGIEILDVVCNASGATPTRGTPIRKKSRAWFDDELPAWHTTTGTEVEYWFQDERDPAAVYVYPQVPAGKAEVIYAATPADLASLANNFGLDDVYAEAATFYVLFRLFMKDISKLKSAQYANTYYQLFLSALGIREKSIIDNAALKDMKEQGA